MRMMLIAALVGCATPREPPSAPSLPAEPSGDDLFAAGRYPEAVTAYAHEVQRGDRIVELQVFEIAARLAAAEPSDVMERRLVELQHTYPRSRWGQLAGVIAFELERSTVMRQTVMAAGADLRAANDQLEQTNQRVAALTTQVADQQAALAALRDERAKLVQQLRDADERAAAQDVRTKELETQLAAMKQVDLQRAP